MEKATARHLLSSLPPKEADKIFEAAKKAAGPAKSKRFTTKGTGRYNAVVLPEMPEQIISVKDGGKTALDFELLGQQVVCSRNLSPPVVVEYVGWADADENDKKIAHELERLRSKG